VDATDWGPSTCCARARVPPMCAVLRSTR